MISKTRQKSVRSRKTTVSPSKVEQRMRRLSRRRIFSVNGLGWSISDALVAIVSVAFGYAFSPSASLYTVTSIAVQWFPCAISFSVVLVLTSHIAGLHDPRFRTSIPDLIVRCLLAVGIAMTVLVLGWMLYSYLQIGRYVLMLTMLFATVLMIANRVAAWNLDSAFKQNVCFLGTEKFCARVAQFLDEYPIPIQTCETPDNDVDLSSWASENDVDEIVYDSTTLIDDVGLLECLDDGIKVSSYSNFIEEKYKLIPVDSIDAEWLFSSRLDISRPYFLGVKRIVDFTAAVFGLVVSAPLILLAAFAIRLESPGSPFYSQMRVGRFNRPIRIFKLRTMFKNSETNGVAWAAIDDPRVTRFGRFLRKTRMDELPQLWNVLKGEMSLIGPRPERPEFVTELADKIPFYSQRHLVKPGITGWAQTNYGYGGDVEDSYNKLTYDLYYLKNASVGLDLQICLRTVSTVMKGAR